MNSPSMEFLVSALELWPWIRNSATLVGTGMSEGSHGLQLTRYRAQSYGRCDLDDTALCDAGPMGHKDRDFCPML